MNGFIDMNMATFNRKILSIKKYTLFLSCILFTSLSFSQQNLSPDFKLVIAGKQYGTSSFHQWKWGKHYRKEWTTPVGVPVLILDTVAGGLTPYEAGGGRQSKSLRLRDPQGR
jgi:hypothetical protein